MEAPSASEVTMLLQAWSAGDERALDRLTALVYADLHRAAHRYMAGERSSHTLQTTALIHEVYLRLVDVKRINWQDRSHFLAICARLMRRILIDWANKHNAQKHGGKEPHLPLDEALTVSSRPHPDLLKINDSLNRLAGVDQRKSQVVELRFFGGLSVKETAEALEVSQETVMRDWKLAQAWLLRDLSREEQHGA
jgi:RNA polymerase sigma factor (TIGR02999 family)